MPNAHTNVMNGQQQIYRMLFPIAIVWHIEELPLNTETLQHLNTKLIKGTLDGSSGPGSYL